MHKFKSALCAQTDPDLFFPGKGLSSRPAKELCARCPEREPCEAEGLQGEWYGVWGGLSARQRQADPRWEPSPHWERAERHIYDRLILRLIGLGWSHAEIASEVGVSRSHIENRLDTIRRTTREEEAA